MIALGPTAIIFFCDWPQEFTRPLVSPNLSEISRGPLITHPSSKRLSLHLRPDPPRPEATQSGRSAHEEVVGQHRTVYIVENAYCACCLYDLDVMKI